jgi:hypothetical protein
MININDNFEDIIGKIIDISFNPDLIEIQINNIENKYYEFYVYDIYLNDCDESDVFSFDWIMHKPFRLQPENTQQTLKLIFG